MVEKYEKYVQDKLSTDLEKYSATRHRMRYFLQNLQKS